MNLITQRIMLAVVALSASALITACGAHSTGQATETFTVYEDAPKMSLLDLAPRETVWATSITFLRRCI
jgi:hypothetical protein